MTDILLISFGDFSKIGLLHLQIVIFYVSFRLHNDVTIILRMPCLLLGISRTKLSFLFPLTRSQFFGALFIACFRKNGKINKTQFHHEKRNGVHLSAGKIGRAECLIFETFQLLNLKEDRKCTYNFVSNLSINLSCQIDDLYLRT